MTQRLCRIPQNKPLLMLWKDLHEMFGGRTAFRRFKQLFPEELTAARIAYPDASRITERWSAVQNILAAYPEDKDMGEEKNRVKNPVNRPSCSR